MYLPLYNGVKCMDGVLELLVDKLLSGAENSIIAMRRKGMTLNPAYVQLNEASIALRKELERRKHNVSHKRHIVRFLKDKEFRINVDGETRPWLVEEGDVYDIHNYCKNSYIVRSPDISKTTLILHMRDEGYLYERLTIDA